MNWNRVVSYAFALFLTQALLGFIEGFFFSPSGAVIVAGVAASFLVCAGLFAHLAARQSAKPFIHSWGVLLLEQAVAFLVWLLVGRFGADGWASTPGPMLILGGLVRVGALAAGTSLGIHLRRQRAAGV